MIEICIYCLRVIDDGCECRPVCGRDRRHRIVTFCRPFSKREDCTETVVKVVCRAHRVVEELCLTVGPGGLGLRTDYNRAMVECLDKLPCGCGRPRAACSQRGSW